MTNYLIIKMDINTEIDTSKSLDSDLRISDIDLPLYRYGLIHQIDINNYFNGYNQIKKQRMKSYLIMLLFGLRIFQCILCIKYVRNGRVPNILLDVVQFFG